ncbi:hypothetical protein [uncultured Pseudodesulfovibrio sp.]|uniref:hypothetical protein n=1 Tax=uncultured Pseudodesulfovibrio sp. TaxID=2035858 RepID=UPI0029C6250E|nr:hypothetical protein [uncultured Pseudodesulfovibrio sp.]
MTYYICSVSPRFPENYQIGIHARKWGVEERYFSRIKDVQAGDRLLFVLGGQFVSEHEILSSWKKEIDPLWPAKDGDIFPYRIDISPPTLVGEVPIKDGMQHEISFMIGKVWGGTLQGASGVFNSRMTFADYELACSRLNKAPTQPTVDPESNPCPNRPPLLSFFKEELEQCFIEILSELDLSPFQSDSRNGWGYPIGDGKTIDVLCMGEKSSDFVVVNIGVANSSRDTVLDILHKMSWVRTNLAPQGKTNIWGVILSPTIKRDLQNLVDVVPNLMAYSIKVNLQIDSGS